MEQQQHQKRNQEHGQRFIWVLLIIIASLACIYFYIIPFLASAGAGSAKGSSASQWSPAQQQSIAFTLAQSVQNYRLRINERRRINYGDAFMQIAGTTQQFRPPNPFDGMDAPSGPRNSLHSEAKLKGWALATLRSKLQHLPTGSVINILIFTQVKVCPDCRGELQAWATQLQQVAPSGVTIFLYIWQQTDFDIDHPDHTPVTSLSQIEPATTNPVVATS